VRRNCSDIKMLAPMSSILAENLHLQSLKLIDRFPDEITLEGGVVVVVYL
jgi:hypothetical protein